MTDETDSLLLPILKDLQGRIINLDRKVGDVLLRLDNLGTDHIGVKRDGVRQDEAIAHIQVRQDRIEAQLSRINTRLGLIDTDA